MPNSALASTDRAVSGRVSGRNGRYYAVASLDKIS